VTTADIPGAFMQTEMKGTVQMVLEGTMAELLVKIDPKLYRKHLLIKKGKPIMYVQLKKALYGTLQAGLLFWKDLTKNLKEWDFKINPNVLRIKQSKASNVLCCGTLTTSRYPMTIRKSLLLSWHYSRKDTARRHH
jgi:hypothetical protein